MEMIEHNGRIIELEQLESSINHFTVRLSQRYGLTVTPDEYIELCKAEKKLIYMLTPVKRFMSMTIKGVEVYVVYSNYSGLLLTCVNLHRLPMPSYFKKVMDYESFHAYYLKHHRIVDGCKKWIDDNKHKPDWKMEYFTGFVYPNAHYLHKSLAIFIDYQPNEKREWSNDFMKAIISIHKNKTAHKLLNSNNEK